MSELSASPIEKRKLEEINHVALDDYIIDLAWSPDASKLAAATVEGAIFLIQPEQEMKAIKYQKVGDHTPGANSVSWRQDGQEFASAGQDGLVKIWDGNSGKELCTLEAGASWVSKVAYNPSNNKLATSAGRHLKVWNEQN